ncbi:hypothetical protein GCM10025875_28910 [Litorihabitans aurantiacus]|uniref:Uncharacterized protein n=1 Tax=Litorihabitans aurantiacus TaxID=1930061 RepID=A0AA37XH90_9MICO|nr:hypothetical protein GCM10025875_28910 [Litorihabitans aurantiacus]
MWLEVVGWVGSGLVVWSLMQARVLRFRWMNLAGSAIAAGYNAWLEIWPFAAMNGIITVINVYWLIRLHREAHDAGVYEVVEVRPDDPWLRHVLRVHARDVATFHPSFALEDAGDGGAGADDRRRHAFLVVRRDETVGSVIVRDDGEGTAAVELDWVTPRFRDFTPGEFVHRGGGVFAGKGYRRIVWDDPAPGARDYLERMGFTPEGDGERGSRRWVRAVA